MSAVWLFELLAAQQSLVLRHEKPWKFFLLGAAPEWFLTLHPNCIRSDEEISMTDCFPYVENYQPEFEAFWQAGGRGPMRCGIWSERLPEGADLPLEPTAWHLAGQRLVLIRRLEVEDPEQHALVQKGRELQINYERLMRESSQKEILLHCLVHDLAGPLLTVQALPKVMERESLSEEGKYYIELVNQAAQKQSFLIRDLLDVFAAELKSLDQVPSDPALAPDVIVCAQEIVRLLGPSFAARELSVNVLTGERNESPLLVRAERSKLERIFYNLLQNAIRCTPNNGHIMLAIREETESVLIKIMDDGPGVPPELVPQLFQKFVRGGRTGGKSGLGLFFCRTMVERWGGTIDYKPLEGGGACFWFRLPRF